MALRGAQLTDSVRVLTAPSVGRAADEARRHEPEVVCFEMGNDASALRRLADELGHASPSSALIGIYQAGQLGDSDQESEFLIQALRSRVRDFLRRPISSDELVQILGRHGHGPQSESEGTDSIAGTVVAVVSHKGGVGKSTISTNLGVWLAADQRVDVLLIDAALQLGSTATLLDLDTSSSIVDAARELDRLDSTLLRELSTRHSSGLRVLPAPTNLTDATEVDDAALARLLAVARRSFDVVIVDTAPILDSITMTALDRADRVVIALNQTVPTLAGARAYLETLNELGVPAQDMCIVASSTHPSHAATLRREDLATHTGRPVDVVIPFEKAVLVAENTGEPAIQEVRRGGFSKAVRSLGQALRLGEPVR